MIAPASCHGLFHAQIKGGAIADTGQGVGQSHTLQFFLGIAQLTQAFPALQVTFDAGAEFLLVDLQLQRVAGTQFKAGEQALLIISKGDQGQIVPLFLRLQAVDPIIFRVQPVNRPADHIGRRTFQAPEQIGNGGNGRNLAKQAGCCQLLDDLHLLVVVVSHYQGSCVDHKAAFTQFIHCNIRM